ncbi:MAG TPA: transposase, partial [Candidatus Omnitrophota bacterium]|nr:transposase [Candidatus Omnitrophota bacterium]
MDNHIHLVVEATDVQPISRIMQSILLSYSCHYRNKTAYVGHVWQGRFRSSLIEGEQYIIECINYIH